MYGELATRTIPTGGTIPHKWDDYYYPVGNTRALVRKYNSALTGQWTYTRETMDSVVESTLLTNPRLVTVTDPLGNDTVYHYFASLPNQSQNPPPPDDPEDGFAPEWNDGMNSR